MHTRSLCLIACLVLMVSGCGQADGRLSLSGKVFIDGQPATAAVVSFRPLGHQANTAGIAVREGAFELRADKGLRPGKYSVSVQAYRETGRTFDDPQRGQKMPEYELIPFKKIEPSEIEISPNGPNEFEIQLTAKQ